MATVDSDMHDKETKHAIRSRAKNTFYLRYMAVVAAAAGAAAAAVSSLCTSVNF